MNGWKRRVVLAAIAGGPAFAAGLMLGEGKAFAQTTTIIEEDATGTITITPEQRMTIRRYVQTRRTPPAMVRERVTVGTTVPNTVELYPLPDELQAESPAMRNYRYFVVEDDVVLVNPQTRRVIQVVPE